MIVNQLNSYCGVIPSYNIRRQLALSTLTFDSKCTIKPAYFKMTRSANYLEISMLLTHIRLNLNRFKVMFHLFSGSALWAQLLSIIHFRGYNVMYYSLGPTEVSWGCGGGVLNTLILFAVRKDLIIVG